MSFVHVSIVLFACFWAVESSLLSAEERNNLKMALKDVIIKIDALEARIGVLHKRDESSAGASQRSARAAVNCATTPVETPCELPTQAFCGCNKCPAGPPGKEGSAGETGPAGPKGEPGVTPEEIEKALMNVVSGIKIEVSHPFDDYYFAHRHETGAVFVRWGRSVCPDSSQLIYDGHVAGAHYTHAGGGKDKICLPKDPMYGKKLEGFQSAGYIYGTEYEVSGFNPFSDKNTEGQNLHDANAVCAVCLAVSRSSQVMIPGRMECPNGWVQEYQGYLMSEQIGHKRSSYNCVDSAPEVHKSTYGNQNGALWYLVETTCGGVLPCNPFVSGAELTCTVCTK